MSELVCDKCGSKIPNKAKFCPQCGDPVTDADRVQSTGSEVETIRLVCPKCEHQNLFKTRLPSTDKFICPNCKTQFISRIVRIRSKKSRASKREGKRSFSVRVRDFGDTEDFIEFENASYDDFELKEQDVAAFSYFNNQLRLVQNMTINRYMKISRPSCFVATLVYGPNSIEVRLLRQWRDDKLLPSRTLSRMVRLYYRISPWFVYQFGQMRTFWILARFFLSPIVLVLRIRTHNDSQSS
jgi:DNA-directed RNA polymerase subunit RPC12/RpoP